MMADIQTLMDQYFHWLRDRTSLQHLGEWTEITTPYLDRHNDYLQIYARQVDGKVLLTDDGYTLRDLEQSGCMLDTPKRKAMLEQTLNGFGVQHEKGKLHVNATPETFPSKKHNLLQAMLAVNDLFYLASPTVASLFVEDVVKWLDEKEIRYIPNAKFTGKSHYDHHFDFVIPKSRKAPERMVNAITRPSKDTMNSFIFRWLDTREARAADSRAIVLLNDESYEVQASLLEAYRAYEVEPVLWSRREQVVDLLTA
jgi:hypothetical protein